MGVMDYRIDVRTRSILVMRVPAAVRKVYLRGKPGPWPDAGTLKRLRKKVRHLHVKRCSISAARLVLVVSSGNSTSTMAPSTLPNET